jgi:CSLREA domain-containing protein
MIGTKTERRAAKGRELAFGLLLAVFMAAWVLLAAGAAHTDTTFFVNATDDDTDRTPGNGICDTEFYQPGTEPKCTLRAAIQEANAAAGADTITLPAGEYTLTIPDANPFDITVGDLDIRDDLTINGAGARTTSVVGGAQFDDGIFFNSFVTTTIRGLTVTGGKNTGILNSFGDLTLRRVAVIANNGGIGASGTLTITDSTVSRNQAQGDAGIGQYSGTANITNSTVSGNQAALRCGGICAYQDATINIQSSTIANNISANPGGGIFSNGADSVVNVKNTIVSNNSTADCATNAGGTITSQGNNIDSANSCGFAQTTDKPTDPFLALLANNGGPTDTHALLSGSPAIDSGDSDQAADQRGVSRPQNGDNNASATDDIGAFERNDLTPPSVTTTSPASGATGVRRAANLSATFSESMDRATLNRSTFKLYRINTDGTRTQITNVTVGSSADGLRAVLNPFGTTSTVLAANTRYRAVVTPGAKDRAGNRLDQDRAAAGNQPKVWTFTTGAS